MAVGDRYTACSRHSRWHGRIERRDPWVVAFVRYLPPLFSNHPIVSLLHRALHVSLMPGLGRVSSLRLAPTFFPHSFISCMRHAGMLCACVAFMHMLHRACAHAQHAFVSSVRAGETLAGIRDLLCAQVAGQACVQNGAFRRLSLVENYLAKQARREACAVSTCLRRGLPFFTLVNKESLRCCARYAHLEV